MEFRKDINGLRAIAVIAVVLFHFKESWLPGGFAGVDVFFVISGYLMTGIIFKGLEDNTFSVVRFYLSRSKRIIPALAVLCFMLLVFGWLYLDPLNYRVLGEHVASSIGFVSNVIYWRESGYFDAASYEKWLLHTWSLSVEWQFYIIYPLILIAMKRFMPIIAVKYAIFFGAFIGFIFCVVATYRLPELSYYFLPTRAWEMMFGGVAYLFPWSLNKKLKVRVEWLGFVLIIGSYFFMSKYNPWPGYFALLPVLGAFLLIQSNRKSSIITGNRIFQFVGKSSYSIYLWHWPIVVYMHNYGYESTFSIFSGIALSFVFGVISFFVVEKRLVFNIKELNLINIIKYPPVLGALSLILFGTYVFWTNGADVRFDKSQRASIASIIDANSDWAYPKASYYFEGSPIREIKSNSNGSTLFIGDSLIEQYYPRAQVLANSGLGDITFLTQGGCMPIVGMARPDKKCKSLNKTEAFLKGKKFDNIVLGGYWFHYLSDESPYFISDTNGHYKFSSEKGHLIVLNKVRDLLYLLNKHANQVYFVLPTPTGDMFSPEVLSLNILNGQENNKAIDKAVFTKKYSELYVYMKELSKQFDLILIDPLDSFCPNSKCPITDGKAEPMFRDTIHLKSSYVSEHVKYLDIITSS
ncbi:acyltransferase family protein [Vibrio splendidus]